jgi:hypothetical protein
MDHQGDHELALREKDEEIEVYKSGMEQALMELEELKLVCLHFLFYWLHSILRAVTDPENDTEPG